MADDGMEAQARGEPGSSWVQSEFGTDLGETATRRNRGSGCSGAPKPRDKKSDLEHPSQCHTSGAFTVLLSRRVTSVLLELRELSFTVSEFAVER